MGTGDHCLVDYCCFLLRRRTAIIARTATTINVGAILAINIIRA